MERLLQASQERSCPVFTAMKHTDILDGFNAPARQAISAFTGFVERERAKLQADSSSLQQWAANWLGEIRYETELRRGEKSQETADARAANLKELVLTLSAAPADPMTQLQDFLDDLTLDGEREHEKELTGDAVTLITMHSCKGLEFPRVHIIGLENGLLPHSRAVDGNTLDEERRLFYVAITRAMQTLTLSHCAARKKHGALLPRQPSIFLNELPPDLLESGDEKAKRPVAAGDGKKYFAALRMAAS
jgi:superfamily I DNA/RNA helicase